MYKPLLTHDELTNSVFPALISRIEKFTTPIYHCGNHRGSAVFVVCAGIHGMLTAHHVINKSEKAPKIDLDGDSKEEIILMLMSNKEHAFKIQCNALVEIPIGPPNNGVYGEHGPDLTFIRIPDGPYLTTIKTYKSFWNIENNTSMEEFRSKSRHCIVTGFPESWRTKVKKGVSTNSSYLGIYMFGGFQRDTYRETELFDYMTVNVCPEVDTTKPDDYSGISGGSVWQFSIGKYIDKDHLTIEDVDLVGINFYQVPTDTDVAPLIFHFKKSISTVVRRLISYRDSNS